MKRIAVPTVIHGPRLFAHAQAGTAASLVGPIPVPTFLRTR